MMWAISWQKKKKGRSIPWTIERTEKKSHEITKTGWIAQADPLGARVGRLEVGSARANQNDPKTVNGLWHGAGGKMANSTRACWSKDGSPPATQVGTG